MRYAIGDLHLGHKGICQFKQDDGRKVRPWDDVDKMNEDMIQYWNETVNDRDTVYVLGDVVINRRYLPLIGRLRGRKILVKGNHDIFPIEEYYEHFEDIRACVVKKFAGKNFIMSHIPIHPQEIGRFELNIHGHLHTNKIMTTEAAYNHDGFSIQKSVPDPRYICVSAEQVNYRPKLLEEIIARK